MAQSHQVDLDAVDSSDEDLDFDSAESDIEENDFTFHDWTTVDHQSDRFTESDKTFFGLHGLHPRFDDVDVKDEIFFCNILLPDDIFELLANYTNVRARIYIAQNSSNSSSRVSRWTDTTSDEMKKFLACLLIMGVVRKPRIDMYWTTDELTETPYFANEKCLSRDRFFLLLKFLRFADYTDLKENDPLQKISPFVSHVKRIIQNVYLPEQNVAVDEILLLFKGRVYFRAYIPSKRSRYGIKIYALIDQNGYMWNFFIHTVSSNLQLPASLNISNEFGFSGKVVIFLSHDLFDMNYRIFCDNFFVSDGLAQFLLCHRTHLCGTVRFNRLPRAIKSNFPTEVNSVKHFRKENLLVSCFIEKKQSGKKTVSILDTMGEPSEIEKEVIKKGGLVSMVRRPSSIEAYNKNMGAVDLADAQLHPYDITRKTFNWSRKTGIHLLQRLVLNAYCLYKQRKSDHTFLSFTMKYAKFLFDSTGLGRKSGRKGGRPRLLQTIPQNHVPSKIPPSAKKTNPSLRCRVCTSSGARKETRLICESCEERPPLCAHPCFNIWHS